MTTSPFIFETARMPAGDNTENPLGQPVGQVIDGYGKTGSYGYICAEDGTPAKTTVSKSTSTKFTVDNVPEKVNGVASTYAWTKTDTTTSTTLTDAATKTVTAASNATAGSYELKCTVTNTQMTGTKVYTINVTVV